MKQILKNLAPREQRLITWGGSGLLIALLYAWVWQPIVKERQALHADLPASRANALQMSEDAREVAALRSRAQQNPPNTPINAAILQAGRDTGLSPDAMQISLHDPQHASLNLKSITLEQWNALTVTLSTSARIRVESCIIEPLEKSGQVKVSARFSS